MQYGLALRNYFMLFSIERRTRQRVLSEAVVLVLSKSYLGQKWLSVLGGSSNRCRMKSSVFVVIFCSWGRNDTWVVSRTGSTTCNALMVNCHAPQVSPIVSKHHHCSWACEPV